MTLLYQISKVSLYPVSIRLLRSHHVMSHRMSSLSHSCLSDDYCEDLSSALSLALLLLYLFPITFSSSFFLYTCRVLAQVHQYLHFFRHLMVYLDALILYLEVYGPPHLYSLQLLYNFLFCFCVRLLSPYIVVDQSLVEWK